MSEKALSEEALLYCRRQKIQSKGVILIVFWTALMSVSFSLNHRSLYSVESDLGRNLIHFTLKGFLYMLFPISRWIADTWFGRYKVINTGLFISLGVALLTIAYVTVSLSPYFTSGAIGEMPKLIGLLSLYVGYGCFIANIIQFSTDEMIEIGAFGEQLSALIHWQYWAITLGEFMEITTIGIPSVLLSIATIIISLICLLSIFVDRCFFKKRLTTTPVIANYVENCLFCSQLRQKDQIPAET